MCVKHSHVPRDHTELALLQHKRGWDQLRPTPGLQLPRIALNTPPTPCRQNLEILASLRRELMRAGHLRPPRVCLYASLPAGELPRLQRTVEALGGELAASEGMETFWGLENNFPVCTRTQLTMYQALKGTCSRASAQVHST